MKFKVIDKRTGREAVGGWRIDISGFLYCIDPCGGWVLADDHYEAVPEPDTAEKLLWLVAQEYTVIPRCLGLAWQIRLTWLDAPDVKCKPIAGMTLNEAINAAYEWARKEKEE